jgi:hypothetical protein
MGWLVQSIRTVDRSALTAAFASAAHWICKKSDQALENGSFLPGLLHRMGE